MRLAGGETSGEVKAPLWYLFFSGPHKGWSPATRAEDRSAGGADCRLTGSPRLAVVSRREVAVVARTLESGEGCQPWAVDGMVGDRQEGAGRSQQARAPGTSVTPEEL